MKSWLPEKGERWVFQVRVEALGKSGSQWYVRYRPMVLQQQGAQRELDEKTFLKLFSRSGGSSSREIIPGSFWVLPVDVVRVDGRAMWVEYRHTAAGSEGEVKRVDVHVFRATFRREDPAGVKISPSEAWKSERQEWREAQRMPEKGDRYIMTVEISDVMLDAGRMQVKYVPLEQQTVAAQRVLDEAIFLDTFEPLDGAVQGVNKGDRWFMMVEVTEYGPDMMACWYKPITSKGVPKGEERQLSDHIFLATFSKAD